MKLEQIEAFVRVVELQSFHKAAKALNLTTSAISKKISALENTSDFKLMDRTTRSFSLTEAGELFYKQCCELISQYRQTEATLKALDSEPVGKLAIHSTEFLGQVCCNAR